jgi:predicted PurR-regulated permease PerM
MDVLLKESKYPRVLLSLACLVIIIAGMREASTIIVPFLLSIFIAVMCGLPFSWMRKRGVPSFIAIFAIFSVIAGVVFGIGAYLAASMNEFLLQLPLYQKRIHLLIVMLIKWLRHFRIYISEKMILQYFDPGSIMDMVANILSGLGSSLTYAILIMFTVFFLLIEASSFTKKVFMNGASEKSLETVDRILLSMEKYIALKTWISLATGLLVMALLLALGINYAVLWGVVAFLLNYIPNIGPFIAAIPPILLALVDQGLGTASLVTLGFVIIKTIMGDILEPMVMGKGLSLSMLVVFLSLIFWGWVLGPVGMLLSVPLTMAIKISCESFPSTRWIAVLLSAEGIPESEETASAP